MVTDTGTETRVGAIRALNPLRPVRVVEGLDGGPWEVGARPPLRVEMVEERWRIDDEWWREAPISRMYYDCRLEDGRRVTVARDLVTGAWFGQGG